MKPFDSSFYVKERAGEKKEGMKMSTHNGQEIWRKIDIDLASRNWEKREEKGVSFPIMGNLLIQTTLTNQWFSWWENGSTV